MKKYLLYTFIITMLLSTLGYCSGSVVIADVNAPHNSSHPGEITLFIYTFPDARPFNKTNTERTLKYGKQIQVKRIEYADSKNGVKKILKKYLPTNRYLVVRRDGRVIMSFSQMSEGVKEIYVSDSLIFEKNEKELCIEETINVLDNMVGLK